MLFRAKRLKLCLETRSGNNPGVISQGQMMIKHPLIKGEGDENNTLKDKQTNSQESHKPTRWELIRAIKEIYRQN